MSVEEQQRELIEFCRWCRESGNHVAADAVARWLKMKPSSRAALRRRWKDGDKAWREAA